MKSSRLATQIADMIIADTAGEAICSEIRAAWSAKIADGEDDKPWPHAEVFARLYKRLDPWDKKFAAMLRGVWDKERRIVLANLKKLRKAYHGKISIEEISRILYAAGVFKDEIADAAKSLFIQEMIEEGQNHLDDLEVHVAFDVDNQRIQKWLTEYCPKLSKNLEQVNIDDLKRVLREGIGEGEGIPDLAKRVNELFESYDRYRAELIARSETIRGSMQSALEAYRQSGVVKEKIWMTAEDDRTCDWCMEMQGKVVGLEENYFDKGDEFTIGDSSMSLDYTDTEGPPLHPGCRCAIAAYFEET